MKRIVHLLAALAAAALLGACAAPDVADYAGQKPALELQKYFNGKVDAWGMFTDRSGKVVKRFTVVLDCTWKGDEGTLDEDFTYSDGTRQRRVWHIRKLADGHYVGRAADVIGEAQGFARGNALRWNYTLALPVDGRVIEVSMDDWMYQMSDDVLLNRTAMSKFGIHLGDVTLSFARRK